MKKVACIGAELNWDSVDEFSYSSNVSLLDYDVVIFRPNMRYYFSPISENDYYRGRPSLSDKESFRLRDNTNHWRREIRDAVESGKTVVALLSSFEEVYVATGSVSHSGTGRNRATIRHVEPHNNYMSIPYALAPTSTRGNTLRLASKGAEFLADYWQKYGAISEYHVTISPKNGHPIIYTKSGEKIVGHLITNTSGGGHVVLLPDIEFEADEFLDEAGEWNEESKKFAHQFLSSLLAIDVALRGSDSATPAPEWAQSQHYSLREEANLHSKLAKIDIKIADLEDEKAELGNQLADATAIKGLLYETGKPLEHAILAALRLLGFEAEPFRDADSEFDAVFESPEGRMIGEAEGKDKKSISVDKLRQLSMNIHEDLLRDEVSAPAKPVLFGNGERLTAPEDRGSAFTEKCLKSAQTSNTALVPTIELFKVAQYLSDNMDSGFAKKCREALINAVGIVEFPEVRIK